MDFYENLRFKYGGLTKQCRRVADYYKTQPSEAIYMTAKALGEASGTSAACVIRFFRAMGYESLEELKIHLAQTINSQELAQPLEPIDFGKNGVSDLGPFLLSSTTKALQHTQEMMDIDDFKKALNLLRHARTVYVFGIGASSLAAQDFSHKLNRIGKPCIYHMDGHTNLEFGSVATRKDVVVAISYSGDTKEVYLAAQRAGMNGVPVIAVTRDQPNALSALATIVLRLPATEKRVRSGAFSSKFCQVFITDLLYLGLISDDFESIKEILDDTFQIVRGLKE